jgi:hypothetical protein
VTRAGERGRGEREARAGEKRGGHATKEEAEAARDRTVVVNLVGGQGVLEVDRA